MSKWLQRENVLSFPLGIRIPMVENFKNKENLKNKVGNVIKVAENWYSANGMKNNSSKSEILVISTKKTDKILNEVLENGVKKIVKSKNWIKVLGVYIDHMLSWSKQIHSFFL